MTNQQSFRTVVFIDTMTLHYMRLCLEHARCRELGFPVNDQAVSILKESICSVGEKTLRDSLQRGLETIVLFATKDVQIEYAAISELELLHGISEGTYRLKVAQEGVPYRIWSGFSQKEVRDRITTDELVIITGRIDALLSMIEDSGVLVTRSGSGRTSEVLELAKGIAGLIFMAEIDSVIYASALAAGADFLVTADEFFRETVNNICVSNDQRYHDIRLKLRELIGAVLLETKCDFQLPRAFTVTKGGKLRGVSCFP